MEDLGPLTSSWWSAWPEQTLPMLRRHLCPHPTSSKWRAAPVPGTRGRATFDTRNKTYQQTLKKPGTEPLFLEWTNGPENPPSGCCILLLALQPWRATCSAPEPIWPEIHWFFWQHWGRCLRTLWCSPPSSETPATGPHRVCLKTGHPKSIALSSSSSLFKLPW